MSKHTPGPWHYIGDSLTHRQFNVYAPNSSPNEHICTINNLSVEKLWKRNAETALMNAHLIASAPELLEALENLLAVMNGEGGTKPFAQEIARKAIAKAKGEL